VLSGEFSRDLELTVPGLLFWLGIFFWSKRYLYPLRKHAPPAKSSTPPVAPRLRPPANGRPPMTIEPERLRGACP
jgi:hypothetical protein